MKRATREALLSAVQGVKDLLYEVVWRERGLPPGMTPADFFPSPAAVAEGSQLFAGYLADAGVDPGDRDALLSNLERWSRSRALATLEELGWQRRAGETVDPEALREHLGVLPEHSRVFRRMFEMLARSGVLEESDDGFLVVVGQDDPLPEEMPGDLEEFRFPAGRTPPPRSDRDRAVPAFRPGPGRGPSGRRGPAYAPVQQRRTDRRGSLPEGTGGGARRTGCWRRRCGRLWRHCPKDGA